jgi:hypothetical protein
LQLTTGGFQRLTIIGGAGPKATTITGSVDACAKASACVPPRNYLALYLSKSSPPLLTPFRRRMRFSVDIKATVRTPAGGGTAEVKR